MPASTRVFVISDLHLGGPSPHMMSRPELLAGFIEHRTAMRSDDEAVELVIAGDFVDFLAIEPQASWTADPAEARKKLERTMREPPFDVVFTALGRLVASGHDLTILVGNHDVELALPPVQDALIEHLAATPRQVRFVDDGRAYRLGGALIEHGNRYDGANVNDWESLRVIASVLSRFEEPPVALDVSAGSMLVEQVVNPLKSQYPFIDLLQPEGPLTALLMLAFEPRLGRYLDMLRPVLHARRRRNENMRGAQPGKTRNIAYQPEYTYDPELARAFGSVYEKLCQPPTAAVGLRDWAAFVWDAREDSLSEILGRGDPIPPERLQQIRVVMRQSMGESSAALDGDPGSYGKAAERIRRDSHGAVDVVVMGHTHEARHIGPPERATYINTGTWADVIRVPDEVLAEDADEALSTFLHRLFDDDRSYITPPTYGHLRIDASGAVSRATLERWNP